MARRRRPCMGHALAVKDHRALPRFPANLPSRASLPFLPNLLFLLHLPCPHHRPYLHRRLGLRFESARRHACSMPVSTYRNRDQLKHLDGHSFAIQVPRSTCAVIGRCRAPHRRLPA